MLPCSDYDKKDLSAWSDYFATVSSPPKEWVPVALDSHPSDNGDDPCCTTFVFTSDPRKLGTGIYLYIVYAKEPMADGASLLTLPASTTLPLDNAGRHTLVGQLGLDQTAFVQVYLWRDGDGEVVQGWFQTYATFGERLGLRVPPSTLPVVRFEALDRTHHYGPRLSLVKVDGTAYVFKLANYYLLQELVTMAALPPSTHCIRPEFSVEDEHGFWCGMLVPFQGLSSVGEFLQTLPPADAPQFEFPWALKLAWAIDIAAALAWLHQHIRAWGDLKPDNVVVCRDGRCRLIDYGPTHFITQRFTAPESIANIEAGARSPAEDVYALGMTLWTVATGQPPPPSALVWPEDIRVPSAYRRLVEDCVEEAADARPTADGVVLQLSAMCY
ncbi:Kinase-like protein [Mycena kentingensis (nom. inval.)]|nr:Kinase-like protein [Mycena kentingensis (nom. inval.)]